MKTLSRKETLSMLNQVRISYCPFHDALKIWLKIIKTYNVKASSIMIVKFRYK